MTFLLLGASFCFVAEDHLFHALAILKHRCTHGCTLDNRLANDGFLLIGNQKYLIKRDLFAIMHQLFDGYNIALTDDILLPPSFDNGESCHKCLNILANTRGCVNAVDYKGPVKLKTENPIPDETQGLCLT